MKNKLTYPRQKLISFNPFILRNHKSGWHLCQLWPLTTPMIIGTYFVCKVEYLQWQLKNIPNRNSRYFDCLEGMCCIVSVYQDYSTFGCTEPGSVFRVLSLSTGGEGLREVWPLESKVYQPGFTQIVKNLLCASECL